jgi:hypothetical protein
MTKKNNAMKPFDDKFAENVREVFDTFQEPADMEAWGVLRQKLTNKRKTRILVLPPWSAWAAAAAVMLLISGLLWFYPSEGDLHQPEIATTEKGTDMESTVEVDAGQKDDPLQGEKTVPVLSADINGSEIPSKKVSVPGYVIKSEPEPEAPAIAAITDIQEESTEELAVATDQSNFKEELKTVESPEEPTRPLAVKPTNGQQAPSQNIIFHDEYSQVSDSRTGSSLQITAGSMFAFTHNQVADGVGFAAGVLNEWKVADGVSISTGGILTYNQFSFDPYYTGRNHYFAAMPSHSDQLNGNWDGSFNYDYSNHYQIMAIDIPLNARFRVNQPFRKNQLYISAGFSSLLYLQEQFTENSIVYTESVQLDAESGEFRSIAYSTSVTENETVDAFQRFDFARLLNISFGYAIKRDKGAILVEPFLKYPLGGITSRDIQLGMGGISLKYSFTNQ